MKVKKEAKTTSSQMKGREEIDIYKLYKLVFRNSIHTQNLFVLIKTNDTMKIRKYKHKPVGF